MSGGRMPKLCVRLWITAIKIITKFLFTSNNCVRCYSLFSLQSKYFDGKKYCRLNQNVGETLWTKRNIFWTGTIHLLFLHTPDCVWIQKFAGCDEGTFWAMAVGRYYESKHSDEEKPNFELKMIPSQRPREQRIWDFFLKCMPMAWLTISRLLNRFHSSSPCGFIWRIRNGRGG